jgi:hypothetical protein
VKNYGLVTMKLKLALEASVWNKDPLPEGGTRAQIPVGLLVPTGRARHWVRACSGLVGAGVRGVRGIADHLPHHGFLL